MISTMADLYALGLAVRMYNLDETRATYRFREETIDLRGAQARMVGLHDQFHLVGDDYIRCAPIAELREIVA